MPPNPRFSEVAGRQALVAGLCHVDRPGIIPFPSQTLQVALYSVNIVSEAAPRDTRLARAGSFSSIWLLHDVFRP